MTDTEKRLADLALRLYDSCVELLPGIRHIAPDIALINQAMYDAEHDPTLRSMRKALVQ